MKMNYMKKRKLKKNSNMSLTDVKVKLTLHLWLVPIFIGLGGILMHIAVKDEDQKKQILLF